MLQHIMKQPPLPSNNVLILGFYDRNNAGDEMYKLAIPRIFQSEVNMTFDFRCMDDLMFLDPSRYAFVICGGGDIINKYFMQKAIDFLANYNGRVYAFSIGIPYAHDDAHYLNLFDHTFVRSKDEYKVACRVVGSLNVTYLPDAVMVFQSPPTEFTKKAVDDDDGLVLGVALAQPAFHDNPHEDAILTSIVQAITENMKKSRKVRSVHLLSFNTFAKNAAECDIPLNEKLQNRLKDAGISSCKLVTHLTGAMDLHDYMNREIDVVLAMRYHGIIFALNLNKPVVALYCSPKVGRLVSDFKESIQGSVCMPIDARGLPTQCSAASLAEHLLRAACWQQEQGLTAAPPDYSIAVDLMAHQEKEQCVKVNNNTYPYEPHVPYDEVQLKCKKVMMQYTGMSSNEFDTMYAAHGPLKLGGQDAESIARLVCFCLTDNISSPYLWGLAANMQKADFCLHDAMQYIFLDNTRQRDHGAEEDVFFPSAKHHQRDRFFINIDGGILHTDFSSGYHRSGWAYAIGGLMALDASRHLRSSNCRLLVDTYVDRTFHWGHDILRAMEYLPYRKPWIGIIHHTFDQTHSTYNCEKLFENETFLTSLQSCQGLVTLTEYLAAGLRRALETFGFKCVPVYVVRHPMESVSAVFTMDNFLNNPRRSVVQVGAWLRNPYAIYKLHLPLDSGASNPMNLKKIALKGKEMDMYFLPNDALQKLESILLPSAHDERDVNRLNKCCAGLYSAVLQQLASVDVIDRLSNEEYDALLTKNVVFLNLVDCSAVNTVLECLFRGTPVIVNRHPAIEEVLGSDYPGFYTELHEAEQLLRNTQAIWAMHIHLVHIDKSSFSLDTFCEAIERIACNASRKEDINKIKT